MRFYLTIVFFYISIFTSSSQSFKKGIDTSDFLNFSTLMYSNSSVSDDGKYFAYKDAAPYWGSSGSNYTLISTLGKWQEKIDSTQSPVEFTANCKYAIFKRKGALKLLKLGTSNYLTYYDVDSYEKIYSPKKGSEYVVATKIIVDSLNGEKQEIVKIIDINNQKDYDYKYNKMFCFSPISKKIVLTIRNKDTTYVYMYDIGKESVKVIWKGNSTITNLKIDCTGEHVAFSTENTIWLYKSDISKIEELSFSTGLEFKELSFLGMDKFSPLGKFLIFRMKDSSNLHDIPHNTVDVYSYLDGSFNLDNSDFDYYRFAYNCKNGEYIRLEQGSERFEKFSDDETKAFVKRIDGEVLELYWNKKGSHNDFIILLDDNKRIPVSTIHFNNRMSPSGKFVIGCYNLLGDYYCQNLQTGKTYNLTEFLPISFDKKNVDSLQDEYGKGFMFQKWDRDNVIFCDRYDIWKIDCNNPKNFVNITNGYGRKNHITFRIFDNFYNYDNNDEVWVSAFDEESKNSGFYKIKVGSGKDPELKFMGRYLFREIQKCGINKWIVKRESAEKAPNYFITNDFSQFKSLSEVYPEQGYSWFTTELLHYNIKDGHKSQAILYKPANFDSTKKYPVLFNFYEKESKKLNEYLIPSYGDGFNFDIPWMLSQGYLVCVPDIYFKIGEPAKSIVDYVEGAADYLSNFEFVDKFHYGACGGSFGGYGVNCLGAFSRKFSALVSISGISDVVSGYGTAPGLNSFVYENGQIRMGVSLSQQPDLYLKNSPVAYAKDVATPLLIVIPMIDSKVNNIQAMEWFIGLRREGKPVWMLRYKGDGDAYSHGISDFNDRKDLARRMDQFFKYHLQNGPLPKWMSGEARSKNDPDFSYSSERYLPVGGLLKNVGDQKR